MEISKYYRTQEVSFTMKVNKTTSGKIEIPLYVKMPENTMFNTMSTGISEKDFDEDMETLVPESLGDDWSESCFIQLQKRLKMHYNQFGRIQPADLETFIGEFIIVMSSIGDAINQPLSLADKQKVFKKLLVDISEELNIPVQIPL